MTNWGGMLRAYRSRAKLKQEVVAGQLGVSQAYISRIEAGLTKPSPEIAERITTLITTPEHRPYFDLWEATVVYSPHLVTLLRYEDGEVYVQAISSAFKQLKPPLNAIKPGDTLSLERGFNVGRDVERLIDSGIFSGHIACMEIPWAASADDITQYMYSICVPVRDDVGNWYVHSTARPITEQEYIRWHDDEPDLVKVHRFPENTAAG